MSNIQIEPKYVNAKAICDWYIEKLEKDSTEESRWALQYINLLITKRRGETILGTLYAYPMELTNA